MRKIVSLLTIVLALPAIGCARETRPPPRSAYVPLPDIPARPDFDPDAARAQAQPDMRFTESVHTVPLSGAPAVRNTAGVYAVQQVYRGGKTLHQTVFGSRAPSATYNTNAPAVDESTDPAHAAKIEREAQLAIDVANVPAAAAQVLALVREHKGYVSKDERQAAGASSAELLVRVPAADFDAFLEAVGKIGDVRMRRVRAIDATLEHKDIEILVQNLEAAQARYRELLGKATDPAQILAIERELERVRTDLERVKGRLDYLRDRAAFATIAIGLHSASPEPELPGGYQAHFATGVRALSLVDIREGGTNVYGGAGLSLRFPRGAGDSGRGFALDVDVMRACCKTTPARSDWSYDVLTGFDLFSEALESGRRRFLNPYLGVRIGVAQTQDRLDFAAAAVLGLELLKTRVLVLDVQTRLMALVGNPDGPHGGVQPSLGFDLGF